MRDLKKKVEAILFSTGKFISLEEISRLCKKEEAKVKEALLELMVDYENDEKTSLVVVNEANMWKMTTKEEFGPVVRNVIAETELTKSQMETLAVVAFKYPIKQSDLIKIRTNKAYDHISELEKMSFITRQKYGRSKLIKLTDKFFEYFDLPKEKLKERFKGFEQLASTIEEKEEEYEQAKERQQKMAEEAKKEAEMERKVMEGEVDLVDEKGKEHELEKFGNEEKGPQIEEAKDTLGDLEVVDTKEETEPDVEPEENNEPTPPNEDVTSEIDETSEEETEKNSDENKESIETSSEAEEKEESEEETPRENSEEKKE